MTLDSLPIPPYAMRVLVGPTAERDFDNPGGELVFPDLAADQTRSVLDLGCGCGRLARRLLQQHPRPERYLGVDLHAGMVRWCQHNLTPANSAFQFVHHDVYERGFNPSGRPISELQPVPADDASATLIIAWSVFTHLVEEQIPHYLAECARILAPGGVVRSTWFLFDKRYFPMLQAFQNALYVNPINPTNAVIVDRRWLFEQLAGAGLTAFAFRTPAQRGDQWVLDLRHAERGDPTTDLPVDDAPFGAIVLGQSLIEPHLIGLDSASEAL